VAAGDGLFSEPFVVCDQNPWEDGCCCFKEALKPVATSGRHYFVSLTGDISMAAAAAHVAAKVLADIRRPFQPPELPSNQVSGAKQCRRARSAVSFNASVANV
jgi:hypothetical protein